jgi:stress response protein SCP2
MQHLDVSVLVLNHQDKLAEAQTELIKMDSYKSPRDKVSHRLADDDVGHDGCL